MNEEQFNKWIKDATNALMCVYSAEQAKIVVDWFETIKGRKERDLVGDTIVDKVTQHYAKTGHGLYTSMMARLWLYAPAILDEHEMQALDAEHDRLLWKYVHLGDKVADKKAAGIADEELDESAKKALETLEAWKESSKYTRWKELTIKLSALID